MKRNEARRRTKSRRENEGGEGKGVQRSKIMPEGM